MDSTSGKRPSNQREIADITLTGTPSGTAPAVSIQGNLIPNQNQVTINGGNTEFNPAAILGLTLGGMIPGDTYGQVAVSNDVNLANTQLDLALAQGFTPALGDLFTIIDNQGANPVIGTFAGLAEGDVFTADGEMFHITYRGGDGNDVVLKDVEPYLDVLTWNETTGRWSYAISDGNSFTEVLGPMWNPNAGWDIHYGDFNGDQRQDAAGRTAGGAWYVILSSDAGFTSEYWGQWGSNASQHWRAVMVGDFNGDGNDDIVGRTWRGEQYVSHSTGTNFNMSYWGRIAQSSWVSSVVGDFNGDGLDDVANFRENGAWWVSESDGTGFTLNHYVKLNAQSIADWRNFLVGDFNNDNIDDIIQQTNTGQWWIMNGENGRFKIHFANRWDPNAFMDFQVGDFNGDGRDDLLGRTSTNQIWVNRTLFNGRMNAEYWGAWDSTLNWTTTVGDFNDDGIDDLAGLADSNTWYIQMSTGASFNNQFFGNWSFFTDELETGEVIV